VTLPVVCLVGPTASGKTGVAVELVERFPMEIISVDSAMVYRQMNIGTAKPEEDVLDMAPHHLIDVRDPWQTYSAGDFCTDAESLIPNIHQRGRIPLLVGGTLLYFRALQSGLAPLPPADLAIRSDLESRAAAEGWPALHAELAQADPDAAEKIHVTDRQRIQRALEVLMITGTPISQLQRLAPVKSPFSFIRIALIPDDRQALYQRIETRFQKMIAAGFVEEVRALMGLPDMSPELASMRAVGYRQIWQYLAGQVSLDEAEQQATQATRRLAKRQLTWLRSDADELSFDCLDDCLAMRVGDALQQLDLVDALSSVSS